MTGKIDFDFEEIIHYYIIDFTDYIHYKDNDIEWKEKEALYKNHLKAKIILNIVDMIKKQPTDENINLLRDMLDFDGNEHLYIVY